MFAALCQIGHFSQSGHSMHPQDAYQSTEKSLRPNSLERTVHRREFRACTPWSELSPHVSLVVRSLCLSGTPSRASCDSEGVVVAEEEKTSLSVYACHSSGNGQGLRHRQTSLPGFPMAHFVD